MKTGIGWVLMLCWVGLSGIATGAAAAEAESAELRKTGVTETAGAETTGVSGTGAARTAEAEAAEPRETGAAEAAATGVTETAGAETTGVSGTGAAETAATGVTETAGAQTTVVSGTGATETAETEAAEPRETGAATAATGVTETAGAQTAVVSGTGVARTAEAETAELRETGAAETAEAEAAGSRGTGAAETAEAKAAEPRETGAATAATGVTETAGAETTGVSGTGAAETAEAETAETGVTETAEAQTAEADRGLFSSIVGWFQRWKVDADAAERPATDEIPETARMPRTAPLSGAGPSAKTDGTPQIAREDVTLGHVSQATRDLIAEIGIIRRSQGVAGDPREAEPGEDRAPIHAYVKALETMEKTARVQRRFGMIPVEVGRLPAREVVPADVYDTVQAVIGELRRVKRQLVIEEAIRPAPFDDGTTPSLVYASLTDASFMLDGLVGRPTSSNDLYMHVLQVNDEMALIAAHLGVALASEPPVVEDEKAPRELAQQVLRAAYKVVNLQSRLGMDASGAPDATLAEVTPADVLEAVNHLLVEMARIKLHLNVLTPHTERRVSRSKRAADVFAQILLADRNLDVVTKAAIGAGQVAARAGQDKESTP